MSTVKQWVERNESAPNGWVLRLKTDNPYNVPTKKCYRRTILDEFTLVLSGTGESYFGGYKDDINAAIASALSDLADSVNEHSGAWCEGDCPYVSAEATGGDATTYANLKLGIESNQIADGCTPSEGDPSDLQVVLHSPGDTGWDIGNLMAGIIPTDFPEGDQEAITNWIAALDSQSQGHIASYNGSMYIAGEVTGGTGDYNTIITRLSSTSVRILFQFGTGTPDLISADYSTSADISSNSGTINFTIISASTSPDGWPSAFSATWGNGPDRDLSFTVILSVTSTTGELEYSVDPFYSSTYPQLTAGGSTTVTYSDEHYVPVNDGDVLGKPCYWDVSWVLRRPGLFDCTEEEWQVWSQAPDGFVHPPGRWPKCFRKMKVPRVTA